MPILRWLPRYDKQWLRFDVIAGAEMLNELVRTMRAARIDVALANARQPVIRMARRAGLVNELGDSRIFHTIDAAVQALGGTADRPSLGDAEDVEGS